MNTPRLKIGSLFSGIGGLDIACETALDGETVWQFENADAPRAVLARHFPNATQYTDVVTADPATLPPIDVLCGGFPCQDLSQAGSRKGLTGSRSGLYVHLLRFADALQPQYVVIENVRGLLKYKARLDADFRAIGYGLRWIKLKASDVGAPHRRERVFVLGIKGQHDAPFTLTPTTFVSNGVAAWPTPTCGDARASGSRSLPGSKAHSGTSLTDAVKPSRVKAGANWSTPSASDNRSRGNSESGAVKRRIANGGRQINLSMQVPGRLNPTWVESLMGFPQGWTLPTGDALEFLQPEWPAGRDQAQHAWEAPRLMTGKPVRGRPARLKALGNAVVPAQGIAAIKHLLETK